MGGLGRIGSGIALLVAFSALQVPLYRHYGVPYEDPRGRQGALLLCSGLHVMLKQLSN